MRGLLEINSGPSYGIARDWDMTQSGDRLHQSLHPPLTARRSYFPGPSIAYRAAMCLDYLTAERERQFVTLAQHVGSHFLPSRFQVQFASSVSTPIPMPGGFVCVMLVARISSSSKPFCQDPKFQSCQVPAEPADVIKQRAWLRDAGFANRPPTGSTALEPPVQSATATPILDLPLFPRRLRTLAPPFNPAIGIGDCRENFLWNEMSALVASARPEQEGHSSSASAKTRYGRLMMAAFRRDGC
ncbi:hypothetical protein V8C34DRAFT_292868 [Trichoderma compactum]